MRVLLLVTSLLRFVASGRVDRDSNFGADFSLRCLTGEEETTTWQSPSVAFFRNRVVARQMRCVSHKRVSSYLAVSGRNNCFQLRSAHDFSHHLGKNPTCFRARRPRVMNDELSVGYGYIIVKLASSFRYRKGKYLQWVLGYWNAVYRNDRAARIEFALDSRPDSLDSCQRYYRYGSYCFHRSRNRELW